MGHLSKLTEEYGKKGFNIVAITNEDLDMNLRYMVHNDANFKYTVAIGGGGEYGVTGIPHAYLIGPEGKVHWQGSPGSMPKKKLEALLKNVDKKPAKDVLEARAEKMYAWADKFAEDKQVFRAHHELTELTKKYKGTRAAKKAAERMKELATGDNKAEFDAQKSLFKTLGFVEIPKEKLKKKKRASIAKKLEKFQEANSSKAPGAAKLARKWARIMNSPWR